MKRQSAVAVALIVLFAQTAWSQNKRDQQVQEDKNKLANNEDWFYNDFDEAAREAKSANKPLLVVFR